MIPIAAARLIQSPTPRPAKKKSSGIENARMRTKIVASDADRDRDEALRHGCGKIDADLAQRDDEHRREPEEEHELAERPGVPARHRDRHAFARARVPAGERRDGEHEPAQEPEPSTHAQQAAVERS